MAFRTLIDIPWASNAKPEDIGDADSFVPQNPSYPEPKPNQYKTGWTVSPGAVVKQPHQWMNAWLYSVDWRLKGFYSGEWGWDNTIPYRLGSVVLYQGKRYIGRYTQTGIRPTTIEAWHVSKFGMSSQAEIELTYQQLHAAIDGHTGNWKNPHNVMWSNFYGGVGKSKADIDSAISAVDTKTQEHIGNTNNPHGLTPEQAGTLPVTGGEFSGQVSMLKMVTPVGELNKGPTCFEFKTPNNSFGLNQNGDACKDDEVMLTQGNFHTIKKRNNHKFVLPVPDIHAPLTSGINIYDQSVIGLEYTSNGPVTFTNKAGETETVPANTPAFSTDGLVWAAGVTQKLVVRSTYNSQSGTVVAIVDGKLKIYNGVLNKADLLTYFTITKSIKDIRVFLTPLTSTQQRAIGV